jgi:hypothetical protein
VLLALCCLSLLRARPCPCCAYFCAGHDAQIVVRHRLSHERFERLAGKFLSPEPPCCSDAEDWEDAGGWAAELDAAAEAAGYSQHPMPLDPGVLAHDWPLIDRCDNSNG